MRCTGDGDHGVHRHLWLTSSPRPARAQFERAHVSIAVGPQWRRETPSESGTGAGQHRGQLSGRPATAVSTRTRRAIPDRLRFQSSWLGPRLRHGPSMPRLPSASQPAGPAPATQAQSESEYCGSSPVRLHSALAYTWRTGLGSARDNELYHSMHW